MKEKVTPYLRNLAHSDAIRRQYYVSADESANEPYNDPLMEDTHEVVKGLVHKYSNRALIKVSYQCAAHCRFCTRIRQIGNTEGTLTTTDIDNIIAYLQTHPEINDVILSGGDPLYTPAITLQLLQRLAGIDTIKVVRIGTRLPLQLPTAITSTAIAPLLTLIKELSSRMPFFILIHINHPDELTQEALQAIRHLRTLGVTLLSQTVFLKDINDDAATLERLYTQLYHAGVVPYYLYHCDAVEGIQHFAADIAKETEIASKLTATLSGIACPTYVVDVENGHGKIPMPLNFSQGNEYVTDFNGVQHAIK
jgi:lysine 2,3-aminomutase